MSSQAHSFGWVRSGLIAMATLAVVAVGLGVYQRSLKFPSPKLTKSQPKAGSDTSRDLPIPKEGKATGIELVEDVQSPGGMRPMYESYDPNTGHLRFSLEAEAWHPAEGKKNLLEIQTPRIRFRDPAGRWVTANAEHGRIELSRGASDSDVTPKSGSLTGGVTLQLNRMTEAQRAALPAEKRDTPDPTQLVDVHVEELVFDLEYATMQCLGAFSIEAAEGSLKSRDLSVRYNEADAHFEAIKMGPGVEVLIRDSRMLAQASPAADASKTAESNAEVAENAEESDGGVIIGKDGIPVILASKAPRKNAGKGHRYLASFLGPIAATERQDTELVSEITAELVEVMFSLGSGGGGSLGQKSSKDDSKPDQPVTPKAESVREFRMACAGELDVRWQGALNLGPKAGLPGPEVAVTGAPLKIKNPQIDLEGGFLQYEADGERLVLNRSPDDPLKIDLGNGLVIVAEGAEVDRAKGEINITGPGWITRSGESISTSPEPRSGSTDVQFAERVTLKLGTAASATATASTNGSTATQPLNNLLAAGGATGGREYIRSIETAGHTTISQDNVFIQAEWVQMDFGPPVQGSDFLDQLQRINASGDVLFSRGGEIMTCDDLEATLEQDPAGELVPTRIDLRGHVQAARGERKLAADEWITLEFTSVMEPVRPFDIRRARMEALARGLDPTSLNWSEIERKQADDRRYRAVVRRVDAKGNVEIDGGRRGMGLRGHQVTGTLDEQEEIEFARIIGAPNTPAEVRIDSYAMRSRIIEMDRLNGRMYAPGDGEMSIQSGVGLDGQPSDQPVDVRLTWTDGLEWKQEGDKAVARMTGVISATGTRVVPTVASVEWLDEASAPTLAAAGAELVFAAHPANSILTPAAQAWAFETTEDWLARSRSRRHQPDSRTTPSSGKLDQADLTTTGEIVVEFQTADASTVPGVSRSYGWIIDDFFADSQKSSTTNLRSSFAALPNRPTRLIMTNEATVTSSTLDAATRNLLARNTIRSTGMTLELANQVLWLPQAGLILIEDYEAGAASNATAGDPFARIAGQDMSQTQLTWTKSARFTRSEGRAEFFEDVQLIHVAGQAMHGVGSPGQASTGENAGRRVRMRADRLEVLLSPSGEPSTPSTGPLKAFVAEGRVRIEYADKEVDAGLVGYYADGQILRVQGATGQYAQFTDPQSVVRLPYFEVDLRTQTVNEIGPSNITLYPK